MQAQEPPSPHIGLWTRLEDFDPAELDGLHTDRTVVRGWLMRHTLHVSAADDYVALRGLFEPVGRRALLGQFRRDLEGSTSMRCAITPARWSRPSRWGSPRSARRWPSAGPAPTRACSASPPATCCRWCRSRRAACGATAGGRA